MQDLDTSKLKRAMIDVAIMRAEQTMQGDHEPVVVHPLYREKWENSVRELRLRRLREKRKTRVLAFIIAAVIMALAGCAWRYREKIADFWVTAFDKYDKLELANVEEEFPRTLEEVYLPTYVPEGYELVDQQIDLLKVCMIWKCNNNYLTYTQTVISESKNVGNPNVIDNEIGYYRTETLDGNVVFCYLCDDKQFYIWFDEYKFCLISSNEVIDENLRKIIKKIQKSEEYVP